MLKLCFISRVVSAQESTLLKLRDGSGLVFSSSGDMSKLAASKTKGQESAAGDASFQNCGSALTVTASGTIKSNLIESSCSCSTESQRSSCSTCRRVICDRCFRLCEHCHNHFCSYCTIYNFNNQYDRVYCLECNLQEETIKH
ncbi:hypothetical protein SUGI_0269530 [Cryptomeria japonica]|nr:hypothetical protein SUGI_0269530 [Cryptomeria japonica]